jgi:TP901 family phage tail tape measure protein
MALNLGPLNVLLRLQGAEKFKRETKNVTGGLNKLGKSIAGLLTIRAVGQQFVQATQVFAGFERGMTRVGAVTNSLGTTAFAGLTERAQDLAKTTEFTARQVSDAMGFMGMAGMKTNQIFDATPAVLQLASAGMVDVASAADTVTNIMAGYGLKTEDLNNANNVLVATFTNSNTSLQQLGQSFKYVGPVAKSAGVEFKEAAAVIGLMGNAGIQADMAGTALRGTIIKLLDPTAEGAKIMRQYGINVTDTNGKLKPMIEIFKQLEPIADDSAKMIELFGLRAGPGMQAALTQGTDALEKLIEKIDGAGNIAERIAQAQLETLDGKIKIMKSNFEALQIAIGDAFSETTQSAVESTSGYIADLTKTVKELSRAADGASGSMFELGTESNTAMRNMIRAIGASLGLGMEGVTPSEALPGEFGKGAEIIAKRAETQQKIIDLSQRQNDLLRRGSAGISDYSDQIAKLVAQLNHYDQALKNTGERLRQAVKPATDAAKATEDIVPKPKRKKAMAEQLEGAAGVDAVKALFEGIRDQPVRGLVPMSVKEFDDLMSSFEPDIVIDHSEATKKATETISQSSKHMAEQVAGTVSRFASAFTGGTMGATFGPQLASALGGALGAFAGSPQVGAAIGGVVGELFGPLFDVIANSVEVFKPLIDVFNRFAVSLILPMIVGMAPGMASLARVLERIVPLFEIIGTGLGFLDFAFSNFRIAIENLITAIGNIMTGNIEGAFTTGMQDFVSAEEYLARVEEERAKILEQLNGETNTTADRFRELNEELTNVPTGIKRLRAFQFGAMQGSGRGTPFGQSAFGV